LLLLLRMRAAETAAQFEQRRVRYQGEAAMDRQAKPAGSVENDPGDRLPPPIEAAREVYSFSA
jgi:hypothetical protein